MRPPTHILVVNGIKVRRPVFVLAAPHSGADLLARVLKRSPGFHVTMGRQSVSDVIHMFARRPSIMNRNGGGGAARVLRDALAESWQIVPGACRECGDSCRTAGGVTGYSSCADASSVTRFGDASPDLIYSVTVLRRAFPDARFVQLIRDGRDVAADMMADPDCLAWFKPARLSDETEFPNAFLGLNKDEHVPRWQRMPTAGKCALRWRSAVRLSAALRQDLPRDQLLTLRYEDLIASPKKSLAAVSEYLQAQVPETALYGNGASRVGGWRSRLRPEDLTLFEKVAGEELTRLNYRPVTRA
ncbi:hypothetical protein HNP84_005641 [Thermocatellispora tengchongensis]|uniref:Sulfotransferase n=1 Tax=Thermocatellispora tengchongensis TaxID=1073253 RepID=A0A840PFH3_9ACTN|nr:sulfotransferase [Thermocatellispora tengchongensis]MBB5135897.1 hypothetical protein [Thermocatellispora tengchongensis]